MIITIAFPGRFTTRKHVISLTFGFLKNISKNKFGLGLALVLFCLFPLKLGSETLTLTTYYPAPYAAYASFLTTGLTLLARDGDNVGIGDSTLTPPLSPINGLAGNLYVNDIYLRARDRWASMLSRTTIYTGGKVPGLACCDGQPSCGGRYESLTGAGCQSGWSWTWGGWTINIPQICIGFGKFKVCAGGWTINIPGFTIGFVTGCGTVPGADGKRMWFTYPGVPPASTWISCAENR